MSHHDHRLDTSSPAFSEALESVREELHRIPADELQPITLEISAAVATALGAAPKIALYRPAILARLGEGDAAHVDRLEVVARAAAQAHAEHLVFRSGPDLEPLSAEVVAVRSSLLTDAQSLVNRKLVDPALLGELQGTLGYKNQYLDVLQLVSVFRQGGAALEAQTPVKAADLDRAEALANQLATAVGVREQADAGTSPSAELRIRAYTLFLRTYDEIRRAIGYLRWHEDDVDDIAPSLWAGRRRHPSDDEESALPAAPTNGAGNGIRPGMPGASPFAPE